MNCYSPLTLSQSKTLPKLAKSPCKSSAEHVALMFPTKTLVEFGGRARDSSTTRGLPLYSLPSRCRMALQATRLLIIKRYNRNENSRIMNRTKYKSTFPRNISGTKVYVPGLPVCSSFSFQGNKGILPEQGAGVDFSIRSKKLVELILSGINRKIPHEQLHVLATHL